MEGKTNQNKKTSHDSYFRISEVMLLKDLDAGINFAKDKFDSR